MLEVKLSHRLRDLDVSQLRKLQALIRRCLD